MKRIFCALLFLACSTANAQFVTGQILTAAQLNAAFANVLATTGGTLTGPLTVQGGTTVANLTVNGIFTLAGGFSPSSLSPQAANTDLANVTGSSASPAAVPIPSCSTANSAIKYASGTGWGCGATFALTSGTLAQFAATTSAQLASVISDETGSGSAVFGTSPTIATPAITGGTISGTPISGSTGSFTTLAASGTVSGAGFTSLLSPYAPLASASPTGTWSFAARPTFNGNTPYDTGNLTIANYLTTATAASTYATVAQATTALAATGGSINGVTVGQSTPLAGAFTTFTATDPSNTSSTVTVINTGANGANIKLVGNGSTTPNKYLRANTGVFQVLNSAYSSTVLTLDDVGNLTVLGGITPSQTSGIIGTTTNNNASAGSVGEYVTATASAVSLTSNTSANVTSISLTAGDWDVSGMVSIAPAGTTTLSNSFGGSSTTSATLGALGTYWQFAPGATWTAGAIAQSIPTTRYSFSATTTVYLVANAGFGTSTCTASGVIRARRIR